LEQPEVGVRQTQDRIKIMHSILPSPGEIDEAAKVTWKDNGYDPPLSADIDGISSSQPDHRRISVRIIRTIRVWIIRASRNRS